MENATLRRIKLKLGVFEISTGPTQKNIDCTKASNEAVEVDGDYRSPTKVRNVIRQQYKELGPMNFHQAGVLSCFVILILLWFFREPQFMTGWGDFFHTR